jgi:copper(I)-binding protein
MRIQNLRRLLLPITWLALAFATSCMAATARPVLDMALAPPKGVHVESAWVRAAPPGAMMLAGYMTLRNDGRAPAVFKSAQSDVFGMVDLHRTTIVNGVSTMRLAGEQTIPAGGALRIEPGGLHLMLMQARHELKVGDKVRFRLHFADGTALDVVALVSAEAPVAATH